MAKQEVFDSKITGPIMRACRHIPVDRDSGAASYEVAVERLKAGELVGVYPEATISRSFEIKEFKSGAARMAIAAGVPIIPHIVWGAQRIWTKGHPKKMFRPKVPIVVVVGEPIQPTLPAPELTALLHSRMQHLLRAGAGRLRTASARRMVGSPSAGWRRPHAGGGRRARCRRGQPPRGRQGGPQGGPCRITAPAPFTRSRSRPQAARRAAETTALPHSAQIEYPHPDMAF